MLFQAGKLNSQASQATVRGTDPGTCLISVGVVAQECFADRFGTEASLYQGIQDAHIAQGY